MIFKMTAAGTVTNLHEFTGGAGGAKLYGSLVQEATETYAAPRRPAAPSTAGLSSSWI